MSHSKQPIAVFGATGHTGRFVVAELHRRGHRVVLSGRDPAKLASQASEPSFEVRAADVTDSAGLDRALLGCAAVINCAGPFLDTAVPIIEAALRQGVSYLDVTAEQLSVLTAAEKFNEAARERGIAILPGMGFYGGLGDLLASATLGDWVEADAVEIAIALDSWHPTEGTRRTSLRNTAPRLAIRGGRLQALENPALQRTWSFPEPFGQQDVVELSFSEAVLIARHLQVREVRTFLNKAPLLDVRDPTTPAPRAVDERGRSAQQFVVMCRARRAGETRIAHVRGQDIYAVTAPLVVEAAERAIELERGGVFAPGEVFEAGTVISALSPRDLTFHPPSAAPSCISPPAKP